MTLLTLPTGETVDPDDIAIQANYIGSGVSRSVYRIPRTQSVLKVKRGAGYAGDNRSEYNAYLRLASTGHEASFARCHDISDCSRYLVSEFVDGTLASDGGIDDSGVSFREWSETTGRRISRDLGITDLHDRNVILSYDRGWVIVDYAFNEENRASGGSYAESSVDCDGCGECTVCVPCGNCGSHTCDWCNPEGDPCYSLEGCRATGCSQCVAERKTVHNAVVRFSHALDGWGGAALCSVHRPIGNATWHRRHHDALRAMGQLALPFPSRSLSAALADLADLIVGPIRPVEAWRV